MQYTQPEDGERQSGEQLDEERRTSSRIDTPRSSTTLDRFKDLREHTITLDNSRTLISLLDNGTNVRDAVTHADPIGTEITELEVLHYSDFNLKLV